MKTKQSNKSGLKLDQFEIKSSLIKFKDKIKFASSKKNFGQKSVKIDEYFISGLSNIGSKSSNTTTYDGIYKPRKDFRYFSNTLLVKLIKINN